MENKIKQVAQFLFDNAEFIADQLKESSSYRSLTICFDHFKHDTGDSINSTIGIYDTKGTAHKLSNDFISIELFEAQCRALNIEVGHEKPPKLPETRSEL